MFDESYAWPSTFANIRDQARASHDDASLLFGYFDVGNKVSNMKLASVEAEALWKKNGSPFCEHPDFRRDRSEKWKDPDDWYCTSCGQIWTHKTGDKPSPRGNR